MPKFEVFYTNPAQPFKYPERADGEGGDHQLYIGALQAGKIRTVSDLSIA